ncbi:hypothetical protein [Clostridium tunisiense]|uniref:hypothetical protein n=1 Tax=Clostridium tunisiense TaxID=219748 RepID=UPI0002D6BDB6|nr:hypothetical protein [Clostridium tunisiense]
MYVKNSLEGINYLKFIEDYKELIDVFASADNAGLTEVSIPYLLKNSKISQKELYNQLHTLLELDFLEGNEFSICPYCAHVDKLIENNKRKCTRCKRLYIANNTIEKFRFVNINGEYNEQQKK